MNIKISFFTYTMMDIAKTKQKALKRYNELLNDEKVDTLNDAFAMLSNKYQKFSPIPLDAESLKAAVLSDMLPLFNKSEEDYAKMVDETYNKMPNDNQIKICYEEFAVNSFLLILLIKQISKK